MKILATHAGRFGDLLWALPTVRAIAERYETQVDLHLPESLASIADLLRRQPYIGHVYCDPAWVVQDTAPATPRVPPATEVEYDKFVHVSYDGWPQEPLPYEAARMASRYLEQEVLVDLYRPWITARAPLVPPVVAAERLAIGFTDEWFELKYGIATLVQHVWRRGELDVLRTVDFVCGSPRWDHEGDASPQPWETAASLLRRATVSLTCCSALHVLSVAVGTPTVVVEPNPHRHHPIFWPLGRRGKLVHGVDGNDGQPSFDARHTADLVLAVARSRQREAEA